MDGLAHPRRSSRPVCTDVAALSGVAALGWVFVALWPDGGWPAWPSASLGILALGLSRCPGPVGRRAVASIAGTLGLLAAAAQFGVLWIAALLTP